MKIIKKLNNNVAIAIDNSQHELIVFGKGIGFQQMPYELTDLSKIDRTYYDVDANYLGLAKEIPKEIFELSSKIADYAIVKIDKELNSNIVFTLADHIHFAIQRYEKHMNFKIPISHDIQYLYENEMSVGQKAIEWINKEKHIYLPKDEAVGIAMHFINAENMTKISNSELDNEIVIQTITEIIEEDFSITIDQSGFNYSRFVSHMHYLLKRKSENQTTGSENLKMFESVKKEFEKTYTSVYHIKDYLEEALGWNPSQEELLYLMLHVNRLCTREDCNQ